MRRKEAEVRIEFDKTKVDMDKLFKIEEALSEIGITFDTGASIGDPDGDVRDWEWDWSLEGPVKVYFVRFKREEG
jgi:hypothetical protein